MREIFEETTINGMVLKNRLVRSATWEGMCEADGRPTNKLADWYADLARGECGLIITGYTFVRPDGKQLPGKMGIHTDAFASDMKNIVNVVHDEGGKICVQLVHAGGQTDSETAGRKPLAPSAVEVPQFSEIPAEMSVIDIKEIIDAFGDAARRAKEYGFDAIQLHAAHGYLINQFLSPLTNRREDDYGGSAENRFRFLVEVYRRVRSVVGNDYPVMIKLNGSDFLKGGFDIDDAVYAATILDAEGIDVIEVSGGTPAPGGLSPAREDINMPEKEAYNLPLARELKKAVHCPLMVVGGFRSINVVMNALNVEKMDYVAMARPFIREPELSKRWRLGEIWPARCISCNSCFMPGFKEGGIYCVIEKKSGQKRIYRG